MYKRPEGIKIHDIYDCRLNILLCYWLQDTDKNYLKNSYFRYINV